MRKKVGEVESAQQESAEGGNAAVRQQLRCDERETREARCAVCPRAVLILRKLEI